MKCLLLNIVYQGKITSSQRSCTEKVYSGNVEKSSKDSTATPNPKSMKIVETTQNCGKNTGKVKEATLIQKYLGALKKEIATCVWMKTGN